MKVPNSEQAKVERQKILAYLLNFSHPDGASKARFFSHFGFTPEKWEILAEALCKHCKNNELSDSVESKFGTRYTVEGVFETPNNRNINLRSIWVLEKPHNIPRLITAYPLEEAKNAKGT